MQWQYSNRSGSFVTSESVWLVLQIKSGTIWFFPIWQNLEQCLIVKTSTVQKDITSMVSSSASDFPCCSSGNSIGNYLFKNNCYLREYKSVSSLYSHITDYTITYISTQPHAHTHRHFNPVVATGFYIGKQNGMNINSRDPVYHFYHFYPSLNLDTNCRCSQ